MRHLENLVMSVWTLVDLAKLYHCDAIVNSTCDICFTPTSAGPPSCGVWARIVGRPRMCGQRAL